MRTQSTPTSAKLTPISRLRTQRSAASNGGVVGTHMFAFQPQPTHNPDRLFGRMTYTRWFYSVFTVMPSQDNQSLILRQLHKSLCELAFTPLIEKMTSKSRSQMSSECVFDNEIPHWKIKQLIKAILSKLGVQSLFSQPCYALVKKSLLRLFTNNHHRNSEPLHVYC